MTDSVGIVVATFGNRDRWKGLARKALASTHNQTEPPDAVVWWHGEGLQDARNLGAAHIDTDWLIFLDADDELDVGYVAAMKAASGDIRRPSTLGVYSDGTEDEEPVLIPARGDGLDTGNYIVIGAMVRASLFHAVGGFDDYPILEDWDLWRRMVKAGAIIGDAPDAVYRVGVREGSRNTDTGLHGRIYTAIRSK